MIREIALVTFLLSSPPSAFRQATWRFGPAYEAYCKAINAGKRLPELEDIILTSPFYAYAYAMDVIKDRWIEAEDIIMLEPLVVCLYAINVIKGKSPDKMHNMMILHGIEDPENGHVISYFKFIENPDSPDWSTTQAIKDMWQ